MADEIIGCEITGMESIETGMNRLHVAIRTQLMKRAMTEAGVILAQAQRDSAPEKTDDIPGGNSLPPGALKGDIIVEVDLTGRYPELKVGPTPDTAYVGRFQEFEHDITTHGKLRNRRVVGRSTPKPWMQPAFDESANDALDKFGSVLMEGIEQSNPDSAGDALDDLTGS